MGRLVGKLLLTILAVPLAFMAAGVIASLVWTWDSVWLPVAGFMLVVLGMWILIWRRDVRWNPVRRVGTTLVAAEFVALFALINASVWDDEARFAVLVPLLVSTPAQLFLLWRESAAERAAARPTWRSEPALHCPRCLARLADESISQCPWCGATRCAVQEVSEEIPCPKT